MPSISEYFSKNRYKPKYHLGDRVFGLYNKIPFSGSVALDSDIEGTNTPTVSVMLDLPLKFKGSYLTMIQVTHKDILKPGESFSKKKNDKLKSSRKNTQI